MKVVGFLAFIVVVPIDTHPTHFEIPSPYRLMIQILPSVAICIGLQLSHKALNPCLENRLLLTSFPTAWNA
jgi:hypothetical protein